MTQTRKVSAGVSIGANGEGPQPDIVRFPLTDVGNGRRLAAVHGLDLHYVYPWKSWLVWTGKRWQRDITGEVERRAKSVCRAMLFAPDGIEACYEVWVDTSRPGPNNILRLADGEENLINVAVYGPCPWSDHARAILGWGLWRRWVDQPKDA
jgi:hypothetical protein